MKGLKPYWRELLFGKRGGGGESGEQEVQQVTPPPVTPPSAAEIAAEQFRLYQQYAPQQLGLGEQMAGLISQQLQQPQFMTPQEQAMQLAERQEAVGGLQEAMRTRANIGGSLYGGRSAAAETESVSDLVRAFALQDAQMRQQRMMGLLGLGGGVSPQTFAPGAGQQYAGQMQATLAGQPQYFPYQAQPPTLGGQNWGFLGRWGGQTAA